MDPHTADHRRALWLATAALVAIAVLLAVAPIVPEPRGGGAFRVQAYGSHLLFFGAACIAMMSLVQVVADSTRVIALDAAASLVLVILLNITEIPIASDVAKLLFAAFAGAALARGIERPWWLIPICVIVPLADTWSVYSSKGVTNAVIERAEQDPSWIMWPTIATPIAGFNYEQFGRIGIVDILFTAVFLAVASTWDLGLIRCTVLLTAGFLVSSVFVFEDVAAAIPALPMLCVAFLIAAAPGLWRDARQARAEAAGGGPLSPQ